MRTLAIAAVLALVVGGLGAALVVYSGIYNIAATVQHTAPVFRLMDYAMLRSVKSRSDSIAVPDLTQPQRIRSGAIHYRAHCVQCHGAPGVAPEPSALGMTPAPANLVATARLWKPAEMFWVVKHGIKMTGMPAWKYRLSDDAMWDVIAFVESMVALSPKDYAVLADTLAAESRARSTDAIPPLTAPAPAAAPTPTQTALRGDAKAGRRAAEQYLCATCHVIPGIVGANRHVGPPLNGVGRRQYIAGILINTPENMVRWLKSPQQFDPASAMPALGLTERDALDIAAFLSTLDDVE